MMNEYATVVCPNGRIVLFRLRDQDFNRFKIYLAHPSLTTHLREMWMTEFRNLYPTIDTDDCNGEELATFIRFIMESK